MDDAVAVGALQAEIDEWKTLSKQSKELRALGFAFAEQGVGATVGVLYNAGVFEKGGVLIGSHAYGAILNMLGYRDSGNYLTEDVDVARLRAVSLAGQSSLVWATVLQATGLNFQPFPELQRGKPATSYKVVGAGLRVDLLVPSRTSAMNVVRVGDFDTWATSLPWLGTLLDVGTVPTVLLAKDKVVPIRVPHPEAFCIHKLLTSTLRPSTFATKAAKDRKQAGAIACALYDNGRQEELGDAIKRLPRTVRKHVLGAATLLTQQHLASEHAECADWILATIRDGAAA